MYSLFFHLLLYLFLILISILTDVFLHRAGYPTVGFWFGPVGFLFLLGSLYWSYHKRKKKTKLKFWLSVHEISAWIGTALILVHCGKHFHALLPWIAAILLCIVSFSGHIGRHLLSLVSKGINSESDQWEIIFHNNILKKWRNIHFPIAWCFAFLSLIHIASVFWFGSILENVL